MRFSIIAAYLNPGGGVYHFLKECVCHRKKWFFIAFIVFILELVLFVWPIGWGREDVINFLTGEGAWTPTLSETHPGFCQEFVPQYSNLKSFSLLFLDAEAESDESDSVRTEGSIKLILSEKSGEIVWQEQLDYSRLNLGSYTDFETQLQLKAGESYYLNVICQDGEGMKVVPALCSTDYQMKENICLYETDILEGAQLVTRYYYTDALAKGKLFRILLLSMITAVGIAVGLPQNRWIRTGIGVLLFVAAPWILGRRLELLSLNTSFLLPFAMNWNLALMYLMQLLVLLITCSLRLSVVLTNVALTVLYSVNFFIFAFRGVPVRLNDLSAIGTAAEVADQYNFTPNSHMAMAWCIALALAVWAWNCKPVKKVRFTGKNLTGRILGLVAAVVIATGAGHVLLYTDFLKEQGFQDFHGFDQNMSYHFNGFLVATCMDIQKSRIEKPEGYSLDEVEHILTVAEQTQETVSEEVLPHVILIMNESFSDLRALGDLVLSEENMEFFYSLEDNVVRGYTNASVLGGGTANSEFEVFSGCSMGLLPASYYAYQQCVNRPLDTMVASMKEAGYRTVSIHPEARKNWNRETIYQYLGFEESYWVEDFYDTEIVHNGISDLDTYEMVEELFKNREEYERLFIFDLTMQNHGDYESSNVTPDVFCENAQSSQANLFLSLMKKSDDALQQLITYFEQEKEKVIICIFGDHQPKFSDEAFYDTINSMNSGLSGQERLMNQYKTPFLIWANYDIEEKTNLDISMNYLGALLMKTARIEQSPFFAFLSQQMEQYPVITVNGYRDADGKLSNWIGDQTEFSEYRRLQYNLLFDTDTIEWGF